MEILDLSFLIAIRRCAQQYMLTSPWWMMLNHLSLAQIFEQVEKYKANDSSDVHRARIGSQVELLNKQTLTASLITLSEPYDSDYESGNVSCLSLLGSKLLGAVTDQYINVEVLGQAMKFKVLSVNNTRQA
ncbi:MAG: GreA/GreB family elongation factor [Spongiibacteraceae bacterium]|jgi:transcription elongation GreA/GreB family factor